MKPISWPKNKNSKYGVSGHNNFHILLTYLVKFFFFFFYHTYLVNWCIIKVMIQYISCSNQNKYIKSWEKKHTLKCSTLNPNFLFHIPVTSLSLSLSLSLCATEWPASLSSHLKALEPASRETTKVHDCWAAIERCIGSISNCPTVETCRNSLLHYRKKENFPYLTKPTSIDLFPIFTKGKITHCRFVKVRIIFIAL